MRQSYVFCIGFILVQLVACGQEGSADPAESSDGSTSGGERDPMGSTSRTGEADGASGTDGTDGTTDGTEGPATGGETDSDPWPDPECEPDELGGGRGAPVVSLDASTTDGVAPLAVLFDAKGTTDDVDDPFLDVTYEFSFGERCADPGYDERWGLEGDPFLAGLSKDRYIGAPLAGHVFERPGDYTVTVRATDRDGNFSYGVIEVHVEDPAAIFSGTATVCVSPSGNFDGCPEGAEHVESESFNESASLASAGRRVLLQRGATYSAQDARFFPRSEAILGAYGSGVRPRVLGSGDAPVVRVGGSGARLLDVELVSSIEEVPTDGTASVVDRDPDAPTRDALLLRVHTRNGQHGVSFVGFGSGEDVRHQVSVVDCELDDVAPRTDGSEGGKNLHGDYTRAAIMGNLIGTSPGSFNMRIYSNNLTVWTFNEFAGTAHNRTTIRLQAGGGSASDYTVPTEYFVYGYNAYAPINGRAGESKPPSQTFYNVIQHYVVENNWFNETNGWTMFGQHAALRNNVRTRTAGDINRDALVSITRYELSENHDDGFPAQFPTEGLEIYNNTCYFESSGARGPCVIADGDVDGDAVVVRDNLTYAPAGGFEETTAGPMQASNNPLWGPGDGSPLVSDAPATVLDFARTKDAVVAGAGANMAALEGWPE